VHNAGRVYGEAQTLIAVPTSYSADGHDGHLFPNPSHRAFDVAHRAMNIIPALMNSLY